MLKRNDAINKEAKYKVGEVKISQWRGHILMYFLFVK